MADVILLIAQPGTDEPGATWSGMLHTFGMEDGLGEKVKVVLNRVGSEDSEISLDKAEETIGKKIYWQVPNDYKAMLGARNAGVLLLTHRARKSKIQLNLLDLAVTLCGKTPATAPKKERRGFFSFR